MAKPSRCLWFWSLSERIPASPSDIHWPSLKQTNPWHWLCAWRSMPIFSGFNTTSGGRRKGAHKLLCAFRSKHRRPRRQGDPIFVWDGLRFRCRSGFPTELQGKHHSNAQQSLHSQWTLHKRPVLFCKWKQWPERTCAGSCICFCRMTAIVTQVMSVWNISFILRPAVRTVGWRPRSPLRGTGRSYVHCGGF